VLLLISIYKSIFDNELVLDIDLVPFLPRDGMQSAVLLWQIVRLSV